MSKVWNIQIHNGVNLDLLGKREPEVYGKQNLKDLESYLSRCLQAWNISSVELEFLQSNDEAQYLNGMSAASDGFLVNAGAWSHTSLAIADRLRGLAVPYIEVHLSNVAGREAFRHHSWLSASALSVVSGGGFSSYSMALWGLLEKIGARA